MKEIRRLVFQLVLLLVALLALYLLVVFVPAFRTPGSLRTLQPSAPEGLRPTAESAAIARAPQSFKYFISFTDRGFEPSVLTIRSGETVRFADNARSELDLSGDAPLAQTAPIAVRDYREFTFSKSGTFRYTDAKSGKTGVIKVK